MAFAKFNLCSPCCSNVSVCHPHTLVNIVNPGDGSPTPINVDLWAAIPSYADGLSCSMASQMYPSGGILQGTYPSSAPLSCRIPEYVYFGDNVYGAFISGYQNGTLINLNATMTQQSSIKQRFDVARYTGYNPEFCSTPVPYFYNCPCYEVSGNQSSAWGVVNYQIYPSDYFQGCSTGQYFGYNPHVNSNMYLECSSTYDVCSADICNGTGIDKHKEINLPYCLTHINASIYSEALLGQYGLYGSPECIATYNGAYTDACSGWFQYVNEYDRAIYNIGSVGSCHWSTGVVYQYWNKPNIKTSGCASYYVPAFNSTHLVMHWTDINTTGNTPSNYCSRPNREIIFDCQDLLLDVCGTTTFTPTVLSDKTGYPIPLTYCAVENSCPNCNLLSDNYSYKYTFASTPLTCDVSINFPNTNGQLTYNGTLTLENRTALGLNIWVPNPFTVPCGSSFSYNATYVANSQTVSVSYHGYQITRCFVIGVGTYYSSDCYENEVNYALVHARHIDQNPLFSTIPEVNFGGLYRYHPLDNNNNCLECCDTSTGEPTGAIDCSGGSSCFVGITKCERAANPGASTYGLLWNTQSCCELHATYLNLGYTNWTGFCNAVGRPECIYDGSPLSVQPSSSGNLVSDQCNDILSYSLYDVNGELIYTVSI